MVEGVAGRAAEDASDEELRGRVHAKGVALVEGEELFAKYKDRVAGVVFKEGEFLKVRRKFNT